VGGVKTARLEKADGTVVCARCALATSPWPRMKGLLGRSGLGPDEGMLFRPAGSIHMFFMRFAIDAVFLTKDLEVVKVVGHLKPWRVARARRAKRILELGAGEAARLGIAVGDRLVLDDVAQHDVAA